MADALKALYKVLNETGSISDYEKVAATMKLTAQALSGIGKTNTLEITVTHDEVAWDCGGKEVE